MIEQVFYWTGAAILTGSSVLLCSLIWFKAVVKLKDALGESWWVASWYAYKARVGGTFAKKALAAAIRREKDEILKSELGGDI